MDRHAPQSARGGNDANLSANKASFVHGHAARAKLGRRIANGMQNAVYTYGLSVRQ